MSLQSKSRLLVSACSWILTWFSHTKGRVECRHILRIWDYLICSESSSLVFLISAILLRLFPADLEMNMDSIMEVCQEAKDSFEFTPENTEEIISEAERLRYKFCCKKAWVDEYNSYLLKDSQYALKPIGMLKIISNLSQNKIIAYTPIAILILMLLVLYSSEGNRKKLEFIMGPLLASWNSCFDFVYKLWKN